LTAITLGAIAGVVISRALVTVLDGRFTPSMGLLLLVPAGACALAALITTAMMLPLVRATRPDQLRTL
jgi:hypothetical protein